MYEQLQAPHKHPTESVCQQVVEGKDIQTKGGTHALERPVHCQSLSGVVTIVEGAEVEHKITPCLCYNHYFTNNNHFLQVLLL